MAIIDFDLDQYDPSFGAGAGSDLLPPGDYICQIDGLEVQPSKSGDGSSFLRLDTTVVDGEYTGKRIIQRVNVWHVKPDVADRGKRELRGIAIATGYTGKLMATEDLHGRYLVWTTDQEVNAQFGTQTRIRNWKSVAEFRTEQAQRNGQRPSQQGQNPAQRPPQQGNTQPHGAAPQTHQPQQQPQQNYGGGGYAQGPAGGQRPGMSDMAQGDPRPGYGTTGGVMPWDQ